MPYCSPEQLADLGPLLDCLRRWPRIREPRPGVFYLGDQPFCQFHSRNGQRWADVKRRKGRLPPFVLPPGDQHSARAFQIFLLQAYKLNRTVARATVGQQRCCVADRPRPETRRNCPENAHFPVGTALAPGHCT